MLAGRKALITGASGGLGSAIARRLAKEGCRLLLTARDEDRLAGLLNALRDAGHEAGVVPCDLRDARDVDRLVGEVDQRFGTTDILVNCAGVFPKKLLEETTLDVYEECFAINVRAPFLLSRALARPMVEQAWGRIVNIGSSSAYNGFAGTSAYCASKHALLGLSRSLHAELKPDNVRVFCISPGSIKTPMGRLVEGQDYDTFIEPEAIADLIAYVIASDGNLICDEIRLNRMVIR